MNEIYHHALKLLRRKDYTKQQLLEKLEAKFGKQDWPTFIPTLKAHCAAVIARGEVAKA